MLDNRESLTNTNTELSEIQSKIDKSIAPLAEVQGRINEAVAPLSEVTSKLKLDILYNNPAIEAMRQQISKVDLSAFKLQVSSRVLDAVKAFQQPISSAVSESIRKMMSMQPAITEVLRSPAMDWFRSLDFSPVLDALKNLHLDFDISERYKELNEIYLRTMYQSKWFPYAGWIAKVSLFREVNEIIATSREASKNRERRIDKAILSYYTTTEIRKIKKSWWKSDLDYCIKRTLGQAIEAYLRGEYALTISCLSTMWEGLIYVKANNVPSVERTRQKMEKTKKELKDLVVSNDYGLIFSDYFNDFIVSNCNTVKDVVDGVPNRHGAAHSWYKKYPNKKAALNAILLTDFIINLKPIERTEENDNGREVENALDQ